MDLFIFHGHINWTLLRSEHWTLGSALLLILITFTFASFFFWIEGHNMTIVEADDVRNGHLLIRCLEF